MFAAQRRPLVRRFELFDAAKIDPATEGAIIIVSVMFLMDIVGRAGREDNTSGE